MFSRYINLARKRLPQIDPELRCCHFAFIVNKSRIVSFSTNSHKTHRLNFRHGYHFFSGIHSEMAAIIKGGKLDLSRYNMITFRLSRKGELQMGRPCAFCQKLIEKTGIRKVWYSNAVGEFEILRRIHL